MSLWNGFRVSRDVLSPGAVGQGSREPEEGPLACSVANLASPPLRGLLAGLFSVAERLQAAHRLRFCYYRDPKSRLKDVFGHAGSDGPRGARCPWYQVWGMSCLAGCTALWACELGLELSLWTPGAVYVGWFWLVTWGQDPISERVRRGWVSTCRYSLSTCQRAMGSS